MVSLGFAVGVLLLVLVPGSPSSAVTSRAGEVSAPRLERAQADAEIFFRVHALPSETSAVRDAVASSRFVERFAMVDRDAALREFRRVFRGSPELRGVTAADLPESVRVQFRPSKNGVVSLSKTEAFVDRFKRLDGVETVSEEVSRRRDLICRTAKPAVQVVLSAGADSAAVRSALTEDPATLKVTFISKPEALKTLRCLHRGDPERGRRYTRDDIDALPESFLVFVGPSTDRFQLAMELQAIPGVDTTNVLGPEPTALEQRHRETR